MGTNLLCRGLPSERDYCNSSLALCASEIIPGSNFFVLVISLMQIVVSNFDCGRIASTILAKILCLILCRISRTVRANLVCRIVLAVDANHT